MQGLRSCVLVVALAAIAGALPASTRAELVPGGDVGSDAGVGAVQLDGSRVSLTLSNRTAGTLHDVELFVQAVWHWNDDMNPGASSPGRAMVSRVAGPIAPGASQAVTVQFDPPLEARSDGYYEPRAWVQGFRQVGP